MKKSIEGGVLDLGGTLLNTKPLILRSFAYAFDQFGIEQPTEQAILHVIGLKLSSCFKRLLHDRNLETENLIAAFQKYQRSHTKLVTLFPNTKSLLHFMRDEKLQVAFLSTRSSKSTHDLLESTGITNMCDTVVSLKNPRRVRSHAKSMIQAMSRLDVERSRTFTFGDTITDVLAGKLAHCRITTATTHGFGGDQVKSARPSYVIANNGELIEIMEKLQRGKK